ncbi:CAP domain-containing protein [Neobacillus sp. OS1-32]|nr:CAP domain-containing protein [Neobacillus sp. OS1-32]WML32193.1 CAP domain-containing protein [Neobacillus sp. OS1-32]
MIKKSAGLCLTAILTIGLAACNNNDKTGLNELNDQRNDQVGMNVTNRNNDLNDVRNVRNDWDDNNGPLTENYRNNNDNDVDVNLFNNNRKRNNRDTISAYQTTLDSAQYPHTRAILIEDARYQYVPVNPGSWSNNTGLLQPFQPYAGQQQYSMAKPPVQHAVPNQTQPRSTNQTQQAPKQVQPAPNQNQQAPKQPSTQQNNPTATGTVSQYAQQVISLTNAERRKQGLSELKADTLLGSVAQRKANDMQQNHYFSHTSPTYGSPFDMMRDFGVTYKAAGENIAQGQRTPQEVVNAWMNSPGHRANILNAKYTHIGVGFESAGKHWSQMFIQK